MNWATLVLSGFDGVTAESGVEDGDIMTGVATAMTGPNGEFLLETGVPGDVLLVVRVDGYRPVRKRLGRVATDELVDLSLERPERPDLFVQLVSGGESLAGYRVMIADLTANPEQPAVSMICDAAGKLNADWLEFQRKYYLKVYPPRGTKDPLPVKRGYFVWEGQERIDVLRDLKTVH